MLDAKNTSTYKFGVIFTALYTSRTDWVVVGVLFRNGGPTNTGYGSLQVPTQNREIEWHEFNFTVFFLSFFSIIL